MSNLINKIDLVNNCGLSQNEDDSKVNPHITSSRFEIIDLIGAPMVNDLAINSGTKANREIMVLIKPFLSWTAYAKYLPFSVANPAAVGMVEFSGQNYRPVSSKVLEKMSNEAEKTASRYENDIEIYIKANLDKYPLYISKVKKKRRGLRIMKVSKGQTKYTYTPSQVPILANDIEIKTSLFVEFESSYGLALNVSFGIDSSLETNSTATIALNANLPSIESTVETDSTAQVSAVISLPVMSSTLDTDSTIGSPESVLYALSFNGSTDYIDTGVLASSISSIRWKGIANQTTRAIFGSYYQASDRFTAFIENSGQLIFHFGNTTSVIKQAGWFESGVIKEFTITLNNGTATYNDGTNVASGNYTGTPPPQSLHIMSRNKDGSINIPSPGVTIEFEINGTIYNAGNNWQGATIIGATQVVSTDGTNFNSI